jgi:ATP-dependent RNA helicase DHX37/DHR1
MPQHSNPELLRTPIESVVLLMKSLGVENVGNFPFPTPPDESRIRDALKHLCALQALDASLHITSLGKSMMEFPVAPRYARMIVEALSKNVSEKILDATLCIAAVASTTLDLLKHGTMQQIRQKEIEIQYEQVRQCVDSGSDLMTWLKLIRAFLSRKTTEASRHLCLIHKSAIEAVELLKQLKRSTAIRNSTAELLLDEDDMQNCGAVVCLASAELNRDEQIILRKLISLGLLDQVARMADPHECRIRNVPYTQGRASKTPYLDLRSETIVFIHPSSACAHTMPPPEYVTYCALQSVAAHGNGPLMKGVTSMSLSWLLEAGFDEDSVRHRSK